VHRLAAECGLAGWVRNGGGVEIEVEGAEPAIAAFGRRLLAEAPPLARITAIAECELAPRGEQGFEIRTSVGPAEAATALPPDAAPCAACLAEMADAANRRMAYAFTNCTDCGPRYAVARSLPYDRCRTTMAAFVQCPACQTEYDSPSSRRFHAQPNACAECGPQLSLPQSQVAAALRAGRIVALKNVGGYQLACDADNLQAVARLRQLKRRGRKPFALLAPSMAAVEARCRVGPLERAALQSPARPIVLLDAFAPGRLGIMLPSSPLHQQIFAEGAPPWLVMTSGNRGAEPLARTAAEARAALAGIADLFLDHDREIAARVDDSVGQVAGAQFRLLRRARGYVPAPIALADSGPAVWAAGADLKNTFCLTHGHEALLSPHLGDMENPATAAFAHETLNHYLSLFGVRPRALAFDPHPGYACSQQARAWARDLGIERTLAVQHHHAHIAAAMAEHQLGGEVLGVAFDGTGYGPDGSVWGGEILRASAAGFERLGHLNPVPLLGGDHAVRNPWRTALSWMRAAFGPGAKGEAETRQAAAELWPQLSPGRIGLELQALARPGLAARSTSAGRLFDAVAALLGLVAAGEAISFEAEAPLALEEAAAEAPEAEPCAFRLTPGPPLILDLRPAISSLLVDRRRGERICTLAARFHATVAEAIAAACAALAPSTSLRRVCLAGGVFQNRRLLEAAMLRLDKRGFEVFAPAAVPANDGGLALGQALIARARLATSP